MKKFFVSASFTFLIVSTMNLYAQDTNTRLTLKQCVETGIASNLEVLQSELLSKTEEINRRQSKLNMLPNLNGSATHGSNQGRSIDPFTNSYINQQYSFASYGLSSGVIIFNGFSLQNAVKQYSLSYEASKMDWQQVKDNLTINIILAYLQVLNNEDLLMQTQSQATLSKNQVDRLEALNKEGAIAPSELFDLKGQYANDELNIINTKNALESAKINLCRLMNIPYDKNIELEKINTGSFALVYENAPDKIYEVALQQFPLVKAVDLWKQSAEKAVKVARGQLFPTLSFNGNASTNYSSAASQSVFINTTDVTSTDYVTVNSVQYPVIKRVSNFNSQKITYGDQLNNNLFSSFSLNLRIPLFNSLQQRNMIKLAEIRLKNNELIANSTRTVLQQNIEQAYINMTTASDRYKVLFDQVNSYNESFRAAEVRFNAGVGNSIDYLTAKNNLDRSNINLIAAGYDLVLRMKILDYYQGKQLW